ncbi:hypothetical protein CkaCkLH20_02551 [Colletotrichum karsti]|uniref:BTB domain-containing protein n=1 Tax=Colletotrichum karsti TaxID=1095194 RepID=A0A9P6IBS9_9PEZI|nr:uncharacterized protein CkaCkLH20_02551 [Colletotrichum karsti]KAF9879740.1 hypothetical protein CkaCkLH20_02551 [Colletotrichum karsti]
MATTLTSPIQNPLFTLSTSPSWHKMADPLDKENYEASSLSESCTPPPTPELGFAIPISMSSKKYSTRRFHSLESAGSRQNRRRSLFALFGPGVEEAGDTSQPTATTSQGSSQSSNIPISPTQQLDQMLSMGNNRQAEKAVKMDRDSTSDGAPKQAETGGDKETNEPTASPMMKNIDKSSENSGDVGAGSSDETQLTPNKTKSPVHRHKRNETAVKIVDQESADAVILPSSLYQSPTEYGRDTFSTQKTEGATLPIHLNPAAYSFNQESREITFLPSVYYASGALPAPPRSLPNIPEENTQPDEDDASLLPSTSFNTSAPAHGILKTPVEKKKPNEKKVHFEAAKASDPEDEQCDSDDSDKTVKAGVGGMKAALPPGLSPVIWDEGSEPKIWLKDGKPTLFRPTKDPGYYTCPLWSRQYPEILSNDPKVNRYASSDTDSIVSQDGSQASSSSVTSANTAYNRGSKAPERSRLANSPPVTNTATPLVDYSNMPVMPPMPSGFNYPPVYRNRVVLEVGGRRFISSIDVLERSPYFKYFLAIPFMDWYRGGVIHIDNDGDLFAHILRYLRTGSYPFFWDARTGFDYGMYAMLLQQSRYYLLPKLEAWIMEQKYLKVVRTDVMHRKLEVLEDQEWVWKHRAEGLDSYEVTGVVSSTRDTKSRAGKLKAFGVEKPEKDEEEDIGEGPQEERANMEAIQVFTKSQRTRVNIDLLRSLDFWKMNKMRDELDENGQNENEQDENEQDENEQDENEQDENEQDENDQNENEQDENEQDENDQNENEQDENEQDENEQDENDQNENEQDENEQDENEQDENDQNEKRTGWRQKG